MIKLLGLSSNLHIMDNIQNKLLPTCHETRPNCLVTQGDLDVLSHWSKSSLKLKGDLLEIGSYQGASTLCALENTQGKKHLHAVDPNNYPTFLPNIKNNGFEANFSFYQMPCEKFFSQKIHLRTTYSYIFIDHDHSLENTKLCLENLWPRLEKGGVILIHDYNYPDPDYMPTTEYLNKHWKQGHNPPDCGIYVIQK